jgi:hypothetical protein
MDFLTAYGHRCTQMEDGISLKRKIEPQINRIDADFKKFMQKWGLTC